METCFRGRYIISYNFDSKEYHLTFMNDDDVLICSKTLNDDDDLTDLVAKLVEKTILKNVVKYEK